MSARTSVTRYSSGIELQRARDVDGVDRGVRVVGDRRAGLGDRVVLVADEAEHGLATAFPQDVVAGVDRHTVEPRRERRLPAELRELAQHRHERVLRGVARVVGVTQHPQRDVEDPRLMAFDQRVNASLVACEVPADEFFVGFWLRSRETTLQGGRPVGLGGAHLGERLRDPEVSGDDRLGFLPDGDRRRASVCGSITQPFLASFADGSSATMEFAAA